MRTTIRQLGWLVAIWLASVMVLGVVGFAIRVVLKP
jgi:preprotein translocase subunit Sss1